MRKKKTYFKCVFFYLLFEYDQERNPRYVIYLELTALSSALRDLRLSMIVTPKKPNSVPMTDEGSGTAVAVVMELAAPEMSPYPVSPVILLDEITPPVELSVN